MRFDVETQAWPGPTTGALSAADLPPGYYIDFGLVSRDAERQGLGPLDAEVIAVAFGVPAHLLTRDLPPGYWNRQLAREIERRQLRARLRRWARR